MKRIFLAVALATSALLCGLDARPRYSYTMGHRVPQVILDARADSTDQTVILDAAGLRDTLQIAAGCVITASCPDADCRQITLHTSADSLIIDLPQLPWQSNAVIIDRFSGALIVEDLPLLPVGFYCYWPVQPTLPEEEVTRGFTMISPYQRLYENRLSERRAYMDRCAQLGMKVHYNLCSVAGGGGAGSWKFNKPKAELRRLLIQEIEAFKNHPALLGWYIADEPALNKADPAWLEEVYRIIKQHDAYHPVSMVLMRTSAAARYADAMDIVMCDPYPIPREPIETVGRVVRGLSRQFAYQKPVWMVPQMFGGSEWWLREPTPAEVRRMTYDAVFYGATGLQFFVRHGHSSFPKAPQSWAEASRIAFEMQEVTPILAEADSMQIITTSQPDVQLKLWQAGDRFALLALCTAAASQQFSFQLPGHLQQPLRSLDGLVYLHPDSTGYHDSFSQMGARWYIGSTSSLPELDEAQPFAGFEQFTTPGTGYGYYVKVRNDRGARAVLDSRTSYSRSRSLRITNPTTGGDCFLRSFPYTFEKGTTYRISIASRANQTQYQTTEKHFLSWIFGQRTVTKPLELQLKCNGKKLIIPLGNQWQSSSFEFTYTHDSARKPVFIELLGPGTVWIDDLAITALP